MIWAVQMSTVEFHPWNSRRSDSESPDEWRIDLDPMPDCDFARIRRVAHVVHEVLDELGMRGFPRHLADGGMHVYVRIAPEWGFPQVRRAALRVRARGGTPRPEGRDDDVVAQGPRPRGVFVDYNQNTRDHTMAAAYPVRGNQRATVSTPVRWEEIDDIEPDDFTIATVPARFAELGDLHEEIDDIEHRIDTLLEWADRDDIAEEAEDGVADLDR